MEAYVEGFRRTDHEAILACLADDVVWVLHGYRTLRGKEAFDGEIENDAAVGSPGDTLFTNPAGCRRERYRSVTPGREGARS
jgi:ketosteroid isomerase-like protein